MSKHPKTHHVIQGTPLDRRAFFEGALALGAALGAASLLVGCERTQTTPTAPVKEVDCKDVSDLTQAQMSTRSGLNYVDISPKTDQNCANCKLFLSKPPCNGCTVVPGPIAAAGWCTAWQPKA